MDLPAPVASGIKPADPMQSLNMMSGMLGLQKSRLQLQIGQETLKTQKAEAQQASLSAQQRLAVAPLIKDPVGSGLMNADGTESDDFDKIGYAAAGDQWPQIATSMRIAAKAKVDYNISANNLNNDESAAVAQAGAAGAATGDLGQYDSVMDATAARYANTPNAKHINTIIDGQKKIVHHLAEESGGAPPQPGQPPKWQTVAMNLSSQFDRSSTGANGVFRQQNSQMDLGGQVQPGVTPPVASGTGGFTPAGPPVDKVIPPGMMVGPNGQIIRIPVGGGGPSLGGESGPSPVKSSGPTTPQWFKSDGSVRTARDDAPPINAPQVEQVQYGKAAETARAYVDQVRSADEQYGTNVTISNAIRRLAKDTKTGPGTETWHNVLGAIGAPVDIQGAANYQTLGSLLDRQAASLRETMGLPGTNQGQQTAESISGRTSYSPDTILYKNDFNQSLVEGIHHYRKGLDRVEGFSGAPSPKAVQAFRSQWIDKFDPAVYELENAKKRLSSDPNAVTEAVGRLTPEQAASIRQKRKALQALSNAQAPNE